MCILGANYFKRIHIISVVLSYTKITVKEMVFKNQINMVDTCLLNNLLSVH